MNYQEYKNMLIKNMLIKSLSTGSADDITKIVFLSTENIISDPWIERSKSMFRSIISALCSLRDKGMIELTVAEIKKYVILENIIALTNKKDFSSISVEKRNKIFDYLNSLSGYKTENGVKQSNHTLEQHGFLAMNFHQILV